MTRTDLAQRLAPRQARSRATIEHVLEVSAELLEEVGLDGFNTNLLAQRAGVGTRAIYRYFPNKFAIILALAERFRDLEREWVGDLRALAGPPDWREAVRQAISGYFLAASQRRGYAALRAASQAVPQIKELDDELSAELARDLAKGLRDLGVTIPASHLAALSRTIIETANRILDVALQCEAQEARLLVRELQRMIVSLLASYLEK
jgi:AcrR family transcriptional regulator